MEKWNSGNLPNLDRGVGAHVFIWDRNNFRISHPALPLVFSPLRYLTVKLL